MRSFDKKVLAKYIFIAIAIAIAISFLIISNQMAGDMAKDERQKMELWADALQRAADNNGVDELDLTLKILSSNKTIPAILCDEDNNVLMHANLDIPSDDSLKYLADQVIDLKKANIPIVIESPNFKQYVYYGDSSTLKRLQYYPFIQIGVMTFFICVSFLALLSTKNAEQNKLWVGLSKETAHQLGTPISSMLAWVEYLKTKTSDVSTLNEMEKDVMRLQVVADRFSKIGSTPSPETREVGEEMMQSVAYLEKRISKKVKFEFDIPGDPLYAKISTSLFSWVIENLTKNAVDAMEGQGRIVFKLSQKNGMVCIDITDSGKGLPKAMFKSVFSPGFTTKERGWGLGLSLAKRIIEDYHKGKIYVKSSEIGVGTTFRIELKREVI
ncbi:histidine kinase/DNA gyrase B/HSP90-like ATPase [Dysgonomonas alginatilytica]|uniref:histidine kinase n=1 Tax=Dysgonomonas alginatilytica TaxID=1605892 RepID=A0A2V3Q0T2_9BACT|nr:HAMP domain-containing sensor histidine kinase [Dysgonomonas alginatilytica]PXV68925.1 histidine kinase/DNA gyrase B/HSP90-like ATPase [Dysgonomonas alginatilytica]